MSNQRDQILQNLTAKYSYIEYASLVSDQAEPLNQPAGSWPNHYEEGIEIIAGKILYLFREMSSSLSQAEYEQQKIGQQEVEQIWTKLKSSHFIVLKCSPTAFLIVRANCNSYLGELRKIVEETARTIQNILEAEDHLPLGHRDENAALLLHFQELSDEERQSSISLSSTGDSPDKIRIHPNQLSTHSKTTELAKFIDTEREELSISPTLPLPLSLRSAATITLSEENRKALELLLAEFIGPIATVVLPQALKLSNNPQALLDILAARLPELALPAFKVRAKSLLGVAEKPVPLPTAPLVTAEAPLVESSLSEVDPDFIRKCERELARAIGPIAPLIVKQTLTQNPYLSRAKLVEVLIQHLPDAAGSDSFRQSLLSVS